MRKKTERSIQESNKLKRNKTTWKKGDVPNPEGKNGYMDYNQRALYLLDNYTVDQVIGMVSCMQKKSGDLKTAQEKLYHKQAKLLPARDFSILMSIAASFTAGGALPFALLLDRAVGKPVQHVKVDQTTTLIDSRAEADKKAEEMLQRLAQRREAAKVVH